MKYKTTYFKLSTNREISVNRNEYLYRIDQTALMNELAMFERRAQKRFPNIIGKSIEELEQTIESLKLKEEKGWYLIHDVLWRKKRIKEYNINLNDRRYTVEDDIELNKHLSEIGNDGWRLHSMKPVNKGTFDFNYSTYKDDTNGSYGYGYGHDILEGFILVWEKE